MQRVIIEGPIEDFGKLDGEIMTVSLQKLKSLETLHLLRSDQEEFATICRIKLQNPDDRIEEVFDRKVFEITPLVDETPGTSIYFMRERRPERARYLMNAGVYFPGPYEINDGRIKIGVMGETKQLRIFLGELEKVSSRLNILSVTNGQSFLQSPLDSLTEKQRKAISTAFQYGYYDLPRKISSQELAEKIGLDSSTFIEHRRKAEKRLLSMIFTE